MINALALFLIGLLFIYNGLQMRKRRLRLGSSWGFRTEETQISEPIWRASHAVGGFTVMVGDWEQKSPAQSYCSFPRAA